MGSPGAVGAQSQADREEHADGDAKRAQDLDEQPAEVVSQEMEAKGTPAAAPAEALTPAMDTSAMLLLAALLASRAAPPLGEPLAEASLKGKSKKQIASIMRVCCA